MKKLYIYPQKIRISIIIVIILGILSVAAAMVVNSQLNRIVNSINPNVDSLVSAITRLNDKESSDIMIQQELEKAAARDSKFGDLLVMNQEGVIIAALNPNAVGQSLAMKIKSNAIKGIPLPFDYKSSDFTHRPNIYQPQKSEGMTFRVFGNFQSADRSIFYLAGTYRVNPELVEREMKLSNLVVLFLKVYRVAFILFWFLLALWVYMDARSRYTNAAAWGILALLTSVVGWSVYLVARPLLNTCLECGTKQIQGLKFCTACGTAFSACCPRCGIQLQESWEFCGNCGNSIVHD